MENFGRSILNHHKKDTLQSKDDTFLMELFCLKLNKKSRFTNKIKVGTIKELENHAKCNHQMTVKLVKTTYFLMMKK